jgi:hypothetical protein
VVSSPAPATAHQQSPADPQRRVPASASRDSAPVVALCSALVFLAASALLLAHDWQAAIPLLLPVGAIGVVVIHVAAGEGKVAGEGADTLEDALLHARDYPSWAVTAIADLRPLLLHARGVAIPWARAMAATASNSRNGARFLLRAMAYRR